MIVCTIDGCGRPHHARGYCASHHGKILRRPHAKRHVPPSERFWSFVSKNGPTQPHMDSPCWEWTGSLQAVGGYGKFTYRPARGVQVTETAHRFAWLNVNGEIPRGLFVLHRCDNRRCVRAEPAPTGHLFLGDHDANMADMVAKGRSVRGEAINVARLSVEAVIDIRARHRAGAAGHPRALARLLGVSMSPVQSVISRRNWAWVPDDGATASPLTDWGCVEFGLNRRGLYRRGGQRC